MAHFGFIRINITPTILLKKIEDVREAGASICFVAYDSEYRVDRAIHAVQVVSQDAKLIDGFTVPFDCI